MGRTVDISGFPTLESADVVKTTLERYTGIGSIEALEVKQKNAGARAYARVQFTTKAKAERILKLANSRQLWYGRSYLKAWEKDMDLVQKPRQFAYEMEGVTLHFGCQVSKEKLPVLCKMERASVKFGFGLRKIYFGVPWLDTSYKLQLSYENIWQVQLHCPRGAPASYLVIQLYGAPRLYQKVEDNPHNFYKELPDDQWVRSTDFTPSYAIGQSSHLCIEIPHDVEPPDLDRYFPYFEESYHPFNLVPGRSFSQSSDLVPIVGPLPWCYLPFKVVFKICALVQHGCIPGPVLDANFYALLDPQRRDIEAIEYVMEKLYSTDLAPKVGRNGESRTAIYRRILSILRNGISIGGKKFEFLAFSSSQLRDNSAWMFASTGRLNAAAIRNWMGDFSSIKNVAKYAARLGQSFGSSKESLSVAQHEVEEIPDVEIVRSGTRYVFSDGIGKISAEFAKRVSSKCGYDIIPSAFQVRYGGYKGVVAVDPTSYMKLSLRKSMCKFESTNTKLDILAVSKYQPCYMNRQLITLLSTLGIPDHIFEKKQREAVCLLDAILVEPIKAEEALDLMSPGENTNVMKGMLSCGYKPNAEPFLSMMLQVFRATKLLELRTKTRVFVPNGRSMMGCLDETRTLEYGEVFVHYSSAGRRPLGDEYSGIGSCKSRIVRGNVVVAKNPCLHPGDVRVLKAVNVPALHHMVDCVVFPQKGKRPHPNECSGSDLDGDIYFVCWDPDLIPRKQFEPMDYTPAPTTQLDHDVTIEEVEEYFTNYIVNDSLGIIANAHTVFADREPTKAMAEPCVELAKLFSIAVDFPKTGVPAEIPANLRPKEYPDFMEKPDKTTYESQNVIGKLFREVKHIAPQNSPVTPFTKDVARQTYDVDMEVPGFEDYTDEAFDFKTDYDNKLGNLMDYYGIKTEAELLTGSIMKMSRSFDRRNDAEAVGLAVKSLRKEARNLFKNGGGDRDTEDDNVYAKASAWYHVTYHPNYWGRYDTTRDHFLSFPWCVHDKLIEIKKRKASIRRHVGYDSLTQQFGTAFSLV
ncbi:putative RNA-directed RNA polymerase [Helianthus annuus]|nr:putative RNA-directed RNA polymerase [Helianthus annuus]